ncbi:hypothetical protein BSKO_11571 [Bryopsis sp. KO-2023]|nr:hypothetical protein BSKO_11571 [Bryopsis sp. KO-2023]
MVGGFRLSLDGDDSSRRCTRYRTHPAAESRRVVVVPGAAGLGGSPIVCVVKLTTREKGARVGCSEAFFSKKRTKARAMSYLLRNIAPLAKPPGNVSLPPPHGDSNEELSALIVLGSEGTDVAGMLLPYQVLVVHGVRVRTIGTTDALLPLTGNVFSTADYVIGDASKAPPERCDIVVVPAVLPQDSTVGKWIEEQWRNGSWILSICEGTHMVASTPILDDGKATTHFYGLDALSERSASVTFLHGHRYILSGKVVTSAGVSAGLDATLYLIERMTSSRDVAMGVSKCLGYDWKPESDPEGDDENRDASFSVDSAEGETLTLREKKPADRIRVGVVVFDDVDDLSLAAVLVSLPRTGEVDVVTFKVDREAKYVPDRVEGVNTNSGAVVVPMTTLNEIKVELLTMVIIPTVNDEEEEESVDVLRDVLPDKCKIRTLGGGQVGESFFAALKIAHELTGNTSTSLAAKMVEHPWNP